MLKFVIFSVILLEDWCIISAVATQNATDTAAPILLPSIPAVNSNDSDKMTLFPGKYNFHAVHQAFYLYPPYGWKNSEGLNLDSSREKIRPDYTVMSEVGAYKFHSRKLSWNRARRTCVEEGGHLAVIRSEAEAKFISEMIRKETTEAWVGFHDKFEEGDWVTVLDEPMTVIAWAPWSTKFTNPNPDNKGNNEHCGIFKSDWICLNDDVCSKEFPFVCKISAT